MEKSINSSPSRRIILALAIVLSSPIIVAGLSYSVAQAASVSIKYADLPAFGDNGSSVVRLQQAIVARGFTLKGGITGNFNSATRYTLKTLQKVVGFRATGVLDEKTAKFLGLVEVPSLASDNLPTVGFSGDNVWALQQALINNGIIVKGGADGKFGLATTIAIGKFQSAKGLSMSRVLDKSTAIALGLLAAPTPVAAAVAKPVANVTPSEFPQSGDRNDAVRGVQQALLNNGITVNGGVDGIYGRATTAALAAFQGRNNLEANGIMDKATAVALGLQSNPVAVPTTPVAAVVGQITIETLPARGQTSETVRMIQNALISKGIEVKGGPDGIFGVATGIAIGIYQESQGIPASKALDVRTGIALGVLPSVESMGYTVIKVFPVQGSCSFSDTWNAPRSGGRQHIGVDITAATGNSLYAVTDGVISQITVGGSLSGNAIKLAQSDGTYFYYAHMDSFAPGIALGTQVRAGQIIGYVGSTGNAGGPHLHFEVHPFGGEAVNPYPVVKVVEACNVTEVLPQS